MRCTGHWGFITCCFTELNAPSLCALAVWVIHRYSDFLYRSPAALLEIPVRSVRALSLSLHICSVGSMAAGLLVKAQLLPKPWPLLGAVGYST